MQIKNDCQQSTWGYEGCSCPFSVAISVKFEAALVACERMTRDDFPIDVKRTVANRVNWTCSNPECRAVTSGPQVDDSKAINIGVAAHIFAASPGGPRYDPGMSSEERRQAKNAIWLCQNCAKLIDNDPTRYTPKLLLDWKTSAESSALLAIGKTVSLVDATSKDLSFEEIEILNSVAEHGEIQLLEVDEMSPWIAVNGRRLGDSTDPASPALYLDALQALVSRGLARHSEGILYVLTGRGFKLGRTLRDSRLNAQVGSNVVPNSKAELDSISKLKSLAAKQRQEINRTDWIRSERAYGDIIDSANEVFRHFEEYYLLHSDEFRTLGINKKSDEKGFRSIYNGKLISQMRLAGLDELKHRRSVASVALQVELYKTRPTYQPGLSPDRCYTDLLVRSQFKPDVNDKQEIVWNDVENNVYGRSTAQVAERVFELFIDQIHKPPSMDEARPGGEYLVNGEYVDAWGEPIYDEDEDGPLW